MEYLILLALVLVFLHAFYWAIVRPIIHERIGFQLSSLRDTLTHAHLSKREGVKSQAFHECFERFRTSDLAIRNIGLLIPFILAVRDRSYATELARRESVMAEAPAWLLNIENTRTRLVLVGALSNSPFMLILIIPFALAAASQKVVTWIKAAALAAGEQGEINKLVDHCHA